LSDWTKAVGSGPWMLDDFVAGGSFTYAKNPDYWATDPRYPNNQLPYADKLVMLVIPDVATQVAGIRTGKYDLGTFDFQNASNISRTNPEIISATVPLGAQGIEFRLNQPPFNDIRVRQALSMAIDRDAINKSIYGGTAAQNPSGLIVQSLSGWSYPYDEWPQSLKDTYSYNPTAAKQLLADAGYSGLGAVNLRFTLEYQAAGLNIPLMEVFQSYFKDIGVQMDIETVDVAALQSLMRAGKIKQATGGGSSAWAPKRSLEYWYSGGADAGVIVGVNDTNYDALLKAFQTATDASQLPALSQACDKYWIEQNWLVMATEQYFFIMNQPRLNGLSGEMISWPSGAAAWGQQLIWARLWVE